MTVQGPPLCEHRRPEDGARCLLVPHPARPDKHAFSHPVDLTPMHEEIGRLRRQIEQDTLTLRDQHSRLVAAWETMDVLHALAGRIRAAHSRDFATAGDQTHSQNPICAEDGMPWPCDTVKIFHSLPMPRYGWDGLKTRGCASGCKPSEGNWCGSGENCPPDVIVRDAL